MTDKKPTVPTPSPTDEALRDAGVMKLQSRRVLSDILGSYTGTDANGDAPEQDADDL